MAETPTTDHDLVGRLALLTKAELTDTQQGTYDHLDRTLLPWAQAVGFQAKLADGRLIGPFNGFLYSPRLSRGFLHWIDAESADSALSPRVRQVVVLAVGQVWDAAYEIYAHTRVGRDAGLPDEIMAAIVDGSPTLPPGAPEAETVAHTFTRTLITEHTVGDELYARAVDCLSEKGVIDLVHLAGIFMATCALLNAFNIPASQPEKADPSWHQPLAQP